MTPDKVRRSREIDPDSAVLPVHSLCVRSLLPDMRRIHVYRRLDPDIERAVAGEEPNQRPFRNPRTVDQLSGDHISNMDPSF